MMSLNRESPERLQTQSLLPQQSWESFPPSPSRENIPTGDVEEDFRSVINDLTIENMTLKRKLRSYEVPYSAQLDRNRIIQVKIYDLPARKKRELEEILRAFTSTIQGSADESRAGSAKRNCTLHTSAVRSTSNPLALDSAYASVSSGPKCSTLLQSIDHARSDSQSRAAYGHARPSTQRKLESPLPESQMRVLVVRRLEELFTGQNGPTSREHIRNLGLSNFQSNNPESTDETDNDGWVYLNLLVNMARIHDLNVTPDFIQAAIADLSEKFELSQDGKKLRWCGGTECTQIRHDNATSEPRESFTSINDLNIQPSGIKRKVEASSSAAVSVDDDACSLDESNVACSAIAKDDSASKMSQATQLSGRRYYHNSGVRRCMDGPICFYRGLQFYTDLTGDRDNFPSTRPFNDPVDDGQDSQVALDSLDSRIVQNLPHTSLSLSQTAGETLLSPTEPFTGSDFDISIPWSLDAPGPSQPLLDLNASGIGGTQPADHFVLRVETKHSRLFQSTEKKRRMGTRLHTVKIPSQTTNTPLSQMSTEIVSTKFCRLEPSSLPAPLEYFEDTSSTTDDSDSDC